MEAATVAKQVPPEPAEEHDGEAEATRSTEELFQWSAYVHAGAGALECEHGEDGECSDRRHFHAWLCLPNTFHARDITEKALAAKARKRRALQQDGSRPGEEPSDANLTLEESLEAWTLNDTTWAMLLQNIADRRVRAEQPEVARQMRDSDQFDHYDADLEEFRRLGTLDEADRDEEAWERLSADLDDFRVEFEKRCTAMFEREQDILKQMSRDEVLELERRYQTDQAAQEQFLHTYYVWAYYIGARKPVKDTEAFPTERIFSKPEDLRNVSPEAFRALRDKYRSLEGRMVARGDVAGNF